MTATYWNSIEYWGHQPESRLRPSSGSAAGGEQRRGQGQQEEGQQQREQIGDPVVADRHLDGVPGAGDQSPEHRARPGAELAVAGDERALPARG